MKFAETMGNSIHKIYSSDELAIYPADFVVRLTEIDDDVQEGWVSYDGVWQPAKPKATIEQQVGFLMAKTLGLEVEVSPEELSALTASSNVVALPDEASWRVGVRASQGLVVLHDDLRYECIQQHVTQSDWPPNATPALWRVVQVAPEDGGTLQWVAGEAVAAGDLRIYEGVTYRCIQGHTTAAHWTPPAVASLWQEEQA